MSKEKKNRWNRHGKNRTTKQTEQEQQIAALLDQTDEKDLLQISAIHSSVTMPLPNQERLAWSVIDKADLADEEEMERRRAFQKMLRRKKMIRITVVCSAIIILLLVLAWCGVFDRIDPPAYQKYYIASGVSFKGEEPESTLPKSGVDFAIPSMSRMPYVDEDKLDTTIYNALAEYCSANDYAVGEYQIKYQDYVLIDSDLYKACGVLVECMDYKKKAGDQTWKDLGYTGIGMDKTSGLLYQTADRADSEELPEDVLSGCSYQNLIFIDENLPINTYLTYMTIYIKI